MDRLLQDVRYALRVLIKKPGFTAVAVITLALGIGANTAIFSILDAVLLRPLPYKDADRLAVAGLSLPDYRDLLESSRSFDDIAVWASNLYNLSDGGESEQVRGAIVTPNFFPLLGSPLIGRTFKPEDDTEQLAVISHDLWQSRFGGELAVLGKTINLSGRVHAIVGVMPPEFQLPGSNYKLWVTLGSAMSVAPAQAENRQLRIFRAIAHLKPGVTLSQAQSEADSISERLQQQYPSTNSGVRFIFTPLYERLVGDVRPALLIILSAVGLILLIACANVANLLLARASSREREIAVRCALGAGRWQLVRQLLVESVLLSLLGGGLGSLLAAWGVDVLPRLNPSDIPRLSAAGIDFRVLLFTLSLSILTGLIFGLIPALQASRTDLNESLKEGGRGSAGSARGRRLRAALVVGEIAVSLVVLIGAGLLVKSFVRLLQTDAGFVSENLLTMNIELARYKEPQQRAALAASALERIARIPGVVAAGGGTGLPPAVAQRVTRFEIAGLQIENPDNRTAYFIAVSPDYFHALGTPLLQGRAFDERDAEGAAKVVVISQGMARRLFANDEPLGKQLKLVNQEHDDDWRTIVGVVGDVKYTGLDDPGWSTLYTPFAQTPFLWTYVMVRTASDPGGFAAAIREAVSSVNPDLTAAKIRTMDQLISESVAQPRFNMLLLSIFGLVALALAAVGIYGVIAYSVTERTHEIGIRQALGARAGDILRLIIRQGMLLTLAGVAIGLTAAYWLTRLMEGLLFGVSATDFMTFASISLLLVAVALLACYIPARRATKVDPMIALRYE
ncbi:MAG: ABC transporter permease [Blastocatellia bacterium]|nr:ABC transporter permease [Blastocatellia bacterium]